MTDSKKTEKYVPEKECRRDFPSGIGAVSLYIHIPFCLKKCRYCDFLSGPQTQQQRERYVQALVREIRGQKDCPPGTPVDTVFFGGGTPSVLTMDQIGRILDAARENFSFLPDAEISLEMNPGTADPGKLLAFRQAGINRLSIGVQSMHDEELRLLGRIHSAEQAREAFVMARDAGFDNISIDLMSALPGQTFDSWADSLRQAVEWKPEHISAYSLIIEPGTPFFDLFEKGKLPALPDEETDREMYHYTRRFLAQQPPQLRLLDRTSLPGTGHRRCLLCKRHPFFQHGGSGRLYTEDGCVRPGRPAIHGGNPQGDPCSHPARENGGIYVSGAADDRGGQRRRLYRAF